MKKFITILLASILILSLAGCKFVTYEDTNGDEDFSLQTLTEADITSNITTYSQKMGTKTMINNNDITANRSECLIFLLMPLAKGSHVSFS